MRSVVCGKKIPTGVKNKFPKYPSENSHVLLKFYKISFLKQIPSKLIFQNCPYSRCSAQNSNFLNYLSYFIEDDINLWYFENSQISKNSLDFKLEIPNQGKHQGIFPQNKFQGIFQHQNKTKCVQPVQGTHFAIVWRLTVRSNRLSREYYLRLATPKNPADCLSWAALITFCKCSLRGINCQM